MIKCRFKFHVLLNPERPTKEPQVAGPWTRWTLINGQSFVFQGQTWFLFIFMNKYFS